MSRKTEIGKLDPSLEEKLTLKAIDILSQGNQSCSQVAEQCGIPLPTLLTRMRNTLTETQFEKLTRPKNSKKPYNYTDNSINETIFSPLEEELLLSIAMSSFYTNSFKDSETDENLINLAQELLSVKNGKIKLLPRSWLTSFKQRHPEYMHKIVGSSNDEHGTSIYLKKIKHLIEKQNIEPQNIYTLETVEINYKLPAKTTTSPQKSNHAIVLECVSATGEDLTPLHFSKQICIGSDDEVNSSKLTSEDITNWIENVFIRETRPRKRLLLMDSKIFNIGINQFLLHMDQSITILPIPTPDFFLLKPLQQACLPLLKANCISLLKDSFSKDTDNEVTDEKLFLTKYKQARAYYLKSQLIRKAFADTGIWPSNTNPSSALMKDSISALLSKRMPLELNFWRSELHYDDTNNDDILSASYAHYLIEHGPFSEQKFAQVKRKAENDVASLRIKRIAMQMALGEL